MTEGTVSNARERRGWTVLDATGLDRPAQARLAWETSLLDGEDGVASFVDAQTGEVLVREGLVDHLADNPTWTVFPNTPPMDYASTDTRVRWCWPATANCALVLDNPASLPWDVDASDFVCNDANCTQRTQVQRRRGLRSGAGVRLAVRQRGDRSLHAHRQRLRRGGPALRGPLRGAREPIADTDPGTPLSETFKLVPGTYARANGFGHVRTTLTVRAGQLRDFRVNMPLNLASGAVDCSQPSQFTSVFTSAADAFPSAIPRPRAPELIIRSFDVPRTRATHVRLRVLTNQCTGAPAYQGDQDDDPRNITDCDEGSTQDDNVRAAELQVFR